MQHPNLVLAPAGRTIARRIGAALWRHRLLAALVLALLLARAIVPAVLGTAQQGVAVVVAARALPAGATLAATDLSIARLAVPGPGFFTKAGDAAGQRLAIALPAGAPITPGALAGHVTGEGAPPGRVVVPVRFADSSVAGLMRPGHLIDVLAGAADGAGLRPAATLASGALVMATSGAAASGGLLAAEDGQVALLAVRPEEAKLISGAAPWAALTAAWVA